MRDNRTNDARSAPTCGAPGPPVTRGRCSDDDGERFAGQRLDELVVQHADHPGTWVVAMTHDHVGRRGQSAGNAEDERTRSGTRL